jgi:hypothetical protein
MKDTKFLFEFNEEQNIKLDHGKGYNKIVEEIKKQTILFNENSNYYFICDFKILVNPAWPNNKKEIEVWINIPPFKNNGEVEILKVYLNK